MFLLALAFASVSLILGFSFYRKYKARLHLENMNTMRYSRVADYYGRPILLAFDYRSDTSGSLSRVEADVDEIYHYGRDYFLKGYSPDRKRCQIFKWSRISNPRVRFDGPAFASIDQLFRATEISDSRAAA
jgi:hypothetical protein